VLHTSYVGIAYFFIVSNLLYPFEVLYHEKQKEKVDVVHDIFLIKEKLFQKENK